jgi:protein-S-isoprenylcysteine O-methyltransferase Ste14/NAD-dependent dihydropyrimidine dehydrogenase PreA subunit
VDWDICTGCGACLEICPRELYEWFQAPGHPESVKKPLPARELDCIQCYRCESECPVEAIRVVFPGPTGFGMVWVLLLFGQIIAGVLYGIMFGPALGIKPLFWLGWLLLAAGLPFFFSIQRAFETKGKPGEGKSVMDTTVIVDTGPFGLVRHPQLLGGSMMQISSALISQHYAVVIIGVIVFAWWYRVAVEEEGKLVVRFGDDYREYMQRVPRLNPLLGLIRLVKARR